jgi:prefoldin subunit 5
MSSPAPTLTKEDLAFVMNGVWNALLVPDWGREDLIQLGMAVFAKTQLKDLDDKKFTRLFPHLVKISESLGELIRVRMNEAMKTVENNVSSLINANEKLQGELEKLRSAMEKNEAPATDVASTPEVEERGKAVAIAASETPVITLPEDTEKPNE